ncbi:hypothetical protein Patl1_11338 [Pistacia atlantica]|nr:hypothetical protein Patl1_11338 [Pistacia atlantica]
MYILQEKRFHNWLENARDWAISRSRFWGTPLPLWISEDGDEVIVMDSVEKLEKLSGVKVHVTSLSLSLLFTVVISDSCLYSSARCSVFEPEDVGDQALLEFSLLIIEMDKANVFDLHRHGMDHITIPLSRGPEFGVLHRVEDVLDCWFESGSMPYAYIHYPFENVELFEKNFPGNFVVLCLMPYASQSF